MRVHPKKEETLWGMYHDGFPGFPPFSSVGTTFFSSNPVISNFPTFQNATKWLMQTPISKRLSRSKTAREMPELTHHREKSHVKTLAKHPQDGTSILFNWAFCHSSLTVSLRFSLYLCRFPHGAGNRLPIQPAYSKNAKLYHRWQNP